MQRCNIASDGAAKTHPPHEKPVQPPYKVIGLKARPNGLGPGIPPEEFQITGQKRKIGGGETRSLFFRRRRAHRATKPQAAGHEATAF